MYLNVTAINAAAIVTNKYMNTYMYEDLDGRGVWNSLISKILAHYSLSLNILLIL